MGRFAAVVHSPLSDFTRACQGRQAGLYDEAGNLALPMLTQAGKSKTFGEHSSQDRKGSGSAGHGIAASPHDPTRWSGAPAPL